MRAQLAESAELNIRGMDPVLVEQVKIAAVRRGGRAALRTWVTQALARALRQEAEPQKAPRLFLCARCVAENRKRVEVVHPVAFGDAVPEGSAPAAATPVPISPSIAKLIEKVRPHGGANGHDPGANHVAVPLQAATAPLPGAAVLPSGGAETPDVPQPSLPAHRAVEVAPGLWVGSDEDYRAISAGQGRDAWCFLQAAKEPWHRQIVGYATKSAPEGPERLAARRGDTMALNFIDVRELGPGGTHYVAEGVIDAALMFLQDRVGGSKPVLVHAGSGKSRAPFLALEWMRHYGHLPFRVPEAVAQFRTLYPRFEPGAGIRAYLEQQEQHFADVSTCGGGIDALADTKPEAAADGKAGEGKRAGQTGGDGGERKRAHYPVEAHPGAERSAEGSSEVDTGILGRTQEPSKPKPTTNEGGM